MLESALKEQLKGIFAGLQLRVDKKTGKCTARLVVVNRGFC